MPAFSARSAAAWIGGPSAIGSVNGMPSSMRSAPAPGSACEDGERRRGIRIAGHHEGDEGGAAFGLAARRSGVDTVRVAHSMRHPQVLGDGEDVLVAAAGEVGDHRCGRPALSARARITLAQARGAGSSAGMMPSSCDSSWKASSASLSVADSRSPGRCRAARSAPGRCRDSRGRPRSSGPR